MIASNPGRPPLTRAAVLDALERAGSASACSIADQIGSHPGSVRGALARLAELGLAERVDRKTWRAISAPAPWARPSLSAYVEAALLLAGDEGATVLELRARARASLPGNMTASLERLRALGRVRYLGAGRWGAA